MVKYEFEGITANGKPATSSFYVDSKLPNQDEEELYHTFQRIFDCIAATLTSYKMSYEFFSYGSGYKKTVELDEPTLRMLLDMWNTDCTNFPRFDDFVVAWLSFNR